MVIAVNLPHSTTLFLGSVIFAVALFFVHRSFYGMRIPVDSKRK